MLDIFKIIGIAGLILICVAMVVNSRAKRNYLAFFGGIGLLIYSIYLKDFIFIILQSVYIVVVAFDYFKRKKDGTRN